MPNQPSSPHDLDRREMLGTMGLAAAGGLALAGTVSAADPPAVEDRGANIKIKSLRGIACGPKTFIKIETDKNVVGWGEVTGCEPKAAAVLAESLFELLDGENPTRVGPPLAEAVPLPPRHARRLDHGPRPLRHRHGLVGHYGETLGRAGLPPARRAAGARRPRMYPSPKATKLGTGGPHPFSGNPSDVLGLAKSIENLRKEKGPEYTIMFDCHCAIPPAMLIQFASAVEPYNVLWLEEPVCPGNVEAFKRVKQQIHIPIACCLLLSNHLGGRHVPPERLRGHPPARRRPDRRHQPDGPQDRGAVRGVPRPCWRPHNTCSELGLSASVHCSAATTLFLIQEGIFRRTYHAGGRGEEELGGGRRRLRLRCRRGRGWASRWTKP